MTILVTTGLRVKCWNYLPRQALLTDLGYYAGITCATFIQVVMIVLWENKFASPFYIALVFI